MKLFHSICAAILLCVLSATSFNATADDWPSWMGAKLDGVSQETAWSPKWPSELPQVWTKEIGIGFSSASIVGGALYSVGHEDGKETVWCLNVNTGDVIWSHSYRAELNDNLYEGRTRRHANSRW